MLLLKPAFLALLALVAAQDINNGERGIDLAEREEADVADIRPVPGAVRAKRATRQMHPNCGIVGASCGKFGRWYYCAPFRAHCCTTYNNMNWPTYCPNGYTCLVGGMWCVKSKAFETAEAA